MQELADYANAVSEPYLSFAEAVCGKWEDQLALTTSISGLNFVGINTSSCGSIAGSKLDHGKLDLPIAPLETALNELKGKPIFLVGHHPIGQFSEGTARILEPTMLQFPAHIFLVMSISRGPLTWSRQVAISPNYSRVRSTRKTTRLGYCLIQTTADGSQRIVRYRTYYPDRKSFDVGTNVSDKGIFEVNSGAVTYWKALKKSPGAEHFLQWIEDAGPSMLPELDETLEGGSLWSSFVVPKIARFQSPSATHSKTIQILSLPHIIEMKENLVSADCGGKSGATVSG